MPHSGTINRTMLTLKKVRRWCEEIKKETGDWPGVLILRDMEFKWLCGLKNRLNHFACHTVHDALILKMEPGELGVMLISETTEKVPRAMSLIIADLKNGAWR